MTLCVHSCMHAIGFAEILDSNSVSDNVENVIISHVTPASTATPKTGVHKCGCFSQYYWHMAHFDIIKVLIKSFMA